MDEEKIEKECCHKTKTRSPEEYKKLVNRLNRIEGQIRGIRFSRELLSNHIRSCVVNDVRAGNDEIVDELLTTLQKLMK